MLSEENRSEFYWDLLVELESRKEEIESQLPNVTEGIFNEYALIQELLGTLYKSVSSLQR